MESPQDKLIRYLQDAHASELGIATVLKDFIDEVGDAQVRAAFQEHLQVTQSQADRLEQRLVALGSGTSDSKSALNKLMGKMSDMLQAAHDTEDKTTQDLIKAYATEHLEIGMYESLYSYATALGDQQTAQLAKQIQAEEEQAARTIYPMIANAAKMPLAKAAQPV